MIFLIIWEGETTSLLMLTFTYFNELLVDHFLKYPQRMSFASSLLYFGVMHGGSPRDALSIVEFAKRYLIEFNNTSLSRETLQQFGSTGEL